MSIRFQRDPQILQIAEAYSLDAVEYAEKAFAIKLDWSDDSVRRVETMLGRLHDERTTQKPSPKQVFQFAKMLGSYVGEVFRKNHGAAWGIVSLDGEDFPGLKADKGTVFWPWGRAQNRILNGSSDNLWHYYQHLLANEQTEAGGTPGT